MTLPVLPGHGYRYPVPQLPSAAPAYAVGSYVMIRSKHIIALVIGLGTYHGHWLYETMPVWSKRNISAFDPEFLELDEIEPVSLNGHITSHHTAPCDAVPPITHHITCDGGAVRTPRDERVDAC